MKALLLDACGSALIGACMGTFLALWAMGVIGYRAVRVGVRGGCCEAG